MNRFTVTYTIKWRVNFAEHYVFNEWREMWNLKTGKRIKKVSKGGSIGYIISGKFYTLTKLKGFLERPPKNTPNNYLLDLLNENPH
jgi:hypothetical protein